MINNFEEQTSPLNEEEMHMMKMMIPAFKNKVGIKNAITSGEIIAKMEERGYKIGGARLRKIVNHIRTRRLVNNLVASSKGYYIENDPDKIMEYRESLIQRANAIKAVAESFTQLTI